jgi:hypothetical protein
MGICGNGAWDNSKRDVIDAEQPTIIAVVPINVCDGRGTAGGELVGNSSAVPRIAIPGMAHHQHGITTIMGKLLVECGIDNLLARMHCQCGNRLFVEFTPLQGVGEDPHGGGASKRQGINDGVDNGMDGVVLGIGRECAVIECRLATTCDQYNLDGFDGVQGEMGRNRRQIN